jgi:hypothetical protein
MLRTIFVIGLFAVGGLFLLKLVFGLIAIVGGLIYLAIRIFSPQTARRLRDRWSGNTY